MSYIGKTPVVGNFQVCDAISTVNNQAAYTMQVSSVNVLPESVNNMLVSLNGVIQKPGSSFTISGSTITFSSALVTGDVINFIQIFGDVLSIGTPSDGVVTSAKLASNSVTTAKITDANVTTAKIADANITGAKTNFVSTSSAAGLQIKGDGTTDGYLQLNCSQNSHGIKLKSPPHSASASYTLTFPNNDGDANQVLTTNGSGVLTWASAGANTPAFHAYLSSTVEVNNNASTKLAADTEIFDTDSNYNNSTYRFQPQTAGKYFVYGLINGKTSAYKLYLVKASVFKNGSEYATNNNTINTNVLQRLGVGIQTVVDMNGSSDYVEMFGTVDIHTNGTEQFVGSGTQSSYFGAYKIIE